MSVWSEAAKDRDRAVAGWIHPFADGSLSVHRNGYVGNRPAVWTTLPTDGTPWRLSGALIHPSRRLVISPRSIGRFGALRSYCSSSFRMRLSTALPAPCCCSFEGCVRKILPLYEGIAECCLPRLPRFWPCSRSGSRPRHGGTIVSSAFTRGFSENGFTQLRRGSSRAILRLASIQTG